MSYGVGCRCGSDPVLLWLWRRLAATAPIGPLVQEFPYAVGMALKKKKKIKEMSKSGRYGEKKKKKKKKKRPKKLLENFWKLNLKILSFTC